MADRSRLLSLPLLVFTLAALLGVGAAVYVLRSEPEPPRTASEPPPLRMAAPDPSPPAPAPDAPASPAVADDTILPTSLPLVLEATMVRDDPTLSLATLSDLEHGTRGVRAPGAPLPDRPGVTLDSVERARVVIDNRGVLESLEMVRTDGPAPPAPPPFDIGDKERIRRRVLATRIRELTDRGLETREDVSDERPPRGLLAEGSLVPVYGEDDELVGVQIGDIAEGGLYDRIGVEDGDVLNSINGVAFGDPAAAASVVAEIAMSEEIEVGVTRPDGSNETLSMPTAELREYLTTLEAQIFGNSPGGDGTPLPHGAPPLE